MPRHTRDLPAPTCSTCGRRIGYNQQAKAIKKGGRIVGFRHNMCPKGWEGSGSKKRNGHTGPESH